MDFDLNKAKWLWEFDVILKSDMSQTCFRVWNITMYSNILVSMIIWTLGI